MDKIRSSIFGLLAIVVFAAAACQRDEIKVYRLAKGDSGLDAPAGDAHDHAAGDGHEHGAPMDMGSADALPEHEPGSKLLWDKPSSWQEKPGDGMRLATFVIPVEGKQKVEMAVVVLAGSAGGDLANVNRWRGQLGVEPVSQADLDKQAVKVDSKAGKVLTVQIMGGAAGHGSAKQAMLAAILNRSQETWFFKLTGPEGAVKGVRDDFMGFLKTLRVKA
ncbi:MAG: hypothetical protein AABZ44_05215 [Elusimicrobiota bacterium]